MLTSTPSPSRPLPRLLRQPEPTAESRAIAQAAMLMDEPHAVVTFEALPQHAHAQALRAGAMPVGSVPYVRAAMQLAGVSEPEGFTYPAPLRSLLRREVRTVPASAVRGRCFVKPARTKQFTGFVRDKADLGALDEHDRLQLEAFELLAPDERVWISEPVHFLCEWRFYVIEGQLAGAARYDPAGLDDALAPDRGVVADAISALRGDAKCPVSYALDFGVLDTGETALVEANDGWALGLYGRALGARDYHRLLRSRWEQLLSTRRAQTLSA